MEARSRRLALHGGSPPAAKQGKSPFEATFPFQRIRVARLKTRLPDAWESLAIQRSCRGAGGALFAFSQRFVSVRSWREISPISICAIKGFRVSSIVFSEIISLNPRFRALTFQKFILAMASFSTPKRSAAVHKQQEQCLDRSRHRPPPPKATSG
jgi:hypothetical protein